MQVMSKDEFENLADGLLYMSETDAPLTYFELVAGWWPPATEKQFLELIGEDSATPVEQIEPEMFFKDLRQGNEEREDHIQALRNAFTTTLKDLRGYRVGEIEIDIYVLGRDNSGKILGLQSLSVET
jgi:hypothetical protein